jgi:hypothetical protein
MSKELVEQLRVIHLTILLMCLILVASAFSQQRGPLRRAYEDAVSILKLTQNGERFQSVAENNIRSRFSVLTPDVVQVQSPFLDVVYSGKLLYTLDRKSPFLFQQETDRFENRRLDGLQGTDKLRYWGNWDSLGEFIGLWDGQILVTENPLRTVQFSHPLDVQTSCGTKLRLIPSAAPNTDDVFSNPQYSLNPSKTQVSMILPVMSPNTTLQGLSKRNCQASVPLNAMAGFYMNLRSSMQEAAGTKWTPTPFKEAFPDLDNSTKYTRSLSAPDLVDYLREESDKEVEKVDMFGAKIPFELVSIFGSILLAACQFYFFCHLAELKKKFKASAESQEVTGYIGLYDIKLARIFTIVSISVLPVLTQAFTLWEVRSAHLVWLAPAIGVVLSSLLACALIVMFLRLWEVMDATSQAAK